MNSVPSAPPLPPVTKLLFNKFNKQPSKQGKRYLKELQFKLVGAIESNNVTEVCKFIRKGMDVNCRILTYKTPLLYSIEKRTSNPTMAEILINAGADVDSPEHVARSRRPIHVAVMVGSLSLVRTLIKHNVLVNGRDGSGMTALHYACYYGFQDIASELILCQDRRNIHLADVSGRSSIHRAIESRHYDVAEIMLKYGAAVNSVDINGWTPLFQSIVFDEIASVKYLLNRGIDVNTKDINGNTPLHVACNPLGREFTRIVLTTSVDYYKRTRRIPTPELQAQFMQEKNGSLQIVQRLVNAGADVTSTNNVGGNPVINTKVPNIMIYLLACGCRVDADTLTFIEQSGNSNFVNQIVTSEAYTEQTKLMRQCRNVIRCTLRKSGDIHSAVQQLPLPRKLIEYVDLIDYD